MSGKAEEMMSLLQELALIKEIDTKYERGPKTEAEVAEFESRRSRKREISEQIVALGDSVS